MTRIIFKYEMISEGASLIVQAENQKAVLVGLDPKVSLSTPCVWIEQDTNEQASTSRVQYLLMGTGWRMEDTESFHCGSCITQDGYVWHVYGKELR